MAGMFYYVLLNEESNSRDALISVMRKSGYRGFLLFVIKNEFIDNGLIIKISNIGKMMISFPIGNNYEIKKIAERM